MGFLKITEGHVGLLREDKGKDIRHLVTIAPLFFLLCIFSQLSKSVCYLHFLDEETGSESFPDLPEIPQLYETEFCS